MISQLKGKIVLSKEICEEYFCMDYKLLSYWPKVGCRAIHLHHLYLRVCVISFPDVYRDLYHLFQGLYHESTSNRRKKIPFLKLWPLGKSLYTLYDRHMITFLQT